MMKTIEVKIIRNPFWFNNSVTVQRGYLDDDGDFALDECDHAGYTLEDMTFGIGDDTTEEEVRVCNKENCGMWFNEFEGSWQE